MASAQLKLVTHTETPLQPTTRDPVRRVFDHWMAIHGKSPARCKLGPTRQQAIAACLLLYDEETLLLAIEGNAADHSCSAGGNTINRDLYDIEWLLATESRVERFANMGERVRQVMDEGEQHAQAQAAAPPSDPAAVLAHRQRIKATIDDMRRNRTLRG